jgi:hypothetical protein
MKKILIIGYYDHANAGDEQYKNTFSYLIKTILAATLDINHYDIVFIDCDKLHDYNENGYINPNDIIVVGGGDVLNNYFLDKVINVFNGISNNIYAISVGVPYTSVITSGKLSIFNSIYVRSYQDLHTLREYHNNVYYIPDISCLTRNIINNTDGTADGSVNTVVYNELKCIRKKKVCLSLSRHIYNKEHSEYYNNIISKLADFIKYLILNNYHVILLPFNTNNTNENENDIIINNDVFQKLTTVTTVSTVSTDKYTRCITNITSTCNEYDIYKIYKLCHVVIPMRFHSCLYSMYAHIPFLPVYTTRKINNLLLDCSWNYGYKLTTNPKDIPIDLNLEILILRFNMLTNEYYNCITELQRINNDITEWSKNYKKIQIESNDNTNVKILIKSVTFVDKIEFTKNKLKDFLKDTGVDSELELELELPKIKDHKKRDTIVQMTSYYLTDGNTDSVYNYGLYEKMFKEDYNIFKEWSWILQDASNASNTNVTDVNETKKSKLQDNPDGLFNINYIDQHDYSGVHRSGWHYVYEKIAFLHNSKSSLFLDLYLDRTFHWNNDINKILGIIPYKQSWCGFIHHTFDTEFSNYNCVKLFENVNFLESLIHCKALFVLSNTLRDRIIIELNKFIILGKLDKIPPVYSYIHPTETDVKLFTISNFKKNNDKKIIHIGGWLRHIYNFYKLNIPDTIITRESSNIYERYFVNRKNVSSINKVVLKGKNMNNYFPNDSLLKDLHELFIKYEMDKDTYLKDETNANANANANVSTNANANANTMANVSTNAMASANSNHHNDTDILNNWHRHYCIDMDQLFSSVGIINYMDNNSYDTLLSENIIFLNLVDASAVNTLIECIVRNTPIIINRIPAVIELLGKNYPLYYNNIHEVYDLINEKNIINAYKYLDNMNKQKFTITYFTSYFINDLRSIQA